MNDELISKERVRKSFDNMMTDLDRIMKSPFKKMTREEIEEMRKESEKAWKEKYESLPVFRPA